MGLDALDRNVDRVSWWRVEIKICQCEIIDRDANTKYENLIENSPALIDHKAAEGPTRSLQ
jgi:hypothetical protein